MNLDQVLQTFLAECQELCREMESALLVLESEPGNDEAINAIFRAAHTIKGSAGLFGFEDLVAFTHVMENVLDHVREGRLPADGDLIALLLVCGDHISHLITRVGAEPMLDPDARTQQETLIRRLEGHLGAPGHHASVAPKAAEQARPARVNWHVSLRFGSEVFRNGMDPASFIRYLSTLGDIVALTLIDDALPEAAEMDPESCYLGFEITLATGADKETIEGVFEFVRDDCRLTILPPDSRVSDCIAHINALPEGDMRLGEILIQSGALTRHELEEGLRTQQEASPPPLGQILVEHQAVQQPVVDAALQKQKQVAEARSQENNTIRVDAAKLDHLITLIGELVTAGAGTHQLAQRSEVTGLPEAASALSRLVEEVRESALKLRMVQIGATFNRFQRVVRDVSRDLGKDIRLIISGAETELDKSVVEMIGDPLTHLVRNSLDHGIEREDVRLAAGKPGRGHVRLHAFHDSGSIVIEVSDDGKGLDRDRILEKAVERGLVHPGQALSDHEIHQLIFEPGFSTADQVTNLSGRGVGMDVVKRDITRLRGTLELESVPGKGSTFRIRLPLTLAIIDGFLVGVGDAAFVIPLDHVVECLELSPDAKAEADRHYVNLRGTVLPFIRLRETFGIPGAATGRESIVVIQAGGQRSGLVVDALMGEFQTVIKPLGPLFSGLKGIVGSTILGTGEVALILDVPALIHKETHREALASDPRLQAQ
ncbi:MAG TPA: chemotaxis protein CheA [Pantanalinema sp.]